MWPSETTFAFNSCFSKPLVASCMYAASTGGECMHTSAKHWVWSMGGRSLAHCWVLLASDSWMRDETLWKTIPSSQPKPHSWHTRNSSTRHFFVPSTTGWGVEEWLQKTAAWHNFGTLQITVFLSCENCSSVFFANWKKKKNQIQLLSNVECLRLMKQNQTKRGVCD